METNWFILKIDEQRMWVSLAIKTPDDGVEPQFISPEAIEKYLRDKGITSGIDKDAITSLCENTEYEQEVIVARGKAPVNGRNGCYTYTVRLEDAKSKPVINADGSVDYYNSLRIAMVSKDEIFAVYIPATPGEYGFTVFSEMLPPVKGRNLAPLKGRGFSISEDQKEYKALFDGRIYKENERIIIEELYVIKGDLGIDQGNIKFNGDVEIKGDIRSGLAIEAKGSIFIHGHVGACLLVSGGNITVRKGIQGRNKCNIVAGGDVACSFVERSSIRAGGSIYANSLLDCQIVARNMVVVKSRKGLVVGGNIIGMQGVFVKEAGNSVGMLTELSAGITSDHMKKLDKLKKDSIRINTEIEFLDKHLNVYDRLDGSSRTKETETLRMKIVRAKVIKAADLKSVDEEINIINSEIDTAKREAVVRVTGIAYAGIKIYMERDNYIEMDTCRDVVYKCINGSVVARPGEE